MFILVTGGSGSGKSEYAEGLAVGSGCPARFYLATMIAYGKEGEAKVQRHRQQRQGKGFLTIEQPRQVRTAVSALNHRNAVLLLECMSNLAANEMFLPDGTRDPRTPEELADQLVGDLAFLAGCVLELIIVTNEVGEDGVCYEPETMDYIRLMGLVNRGLAQLADQVTEVVCGIPVMWKTSEPGDRNVCQGKERQGGR